MSGPARSSDGCGKAVLRASPHAITQLELFGSAVAQAAAETAGPPDADGWVRWVILIEAVDQAATDLMRLGADAEVLEPLELRRRIAECARDLFRLYRGRP